jgi:serine/threonine protein kinase
LVGNWADHGSDRPGIFGVNDRENINTHFAGEKVEQEAVLTEHTVKTVRPCGEELIGTVFDGKYLILDFLGAGGYSRVYKATHIHLKKTVAIKLLHEQYASDEEKRQRLTREARTISSLSHPNIVGLHDYGFCGRIPYLVMDYVEGSSLSELLKRGHQFSMDDYLLIAVQSCDALSAAHAQGLIHRDLKPANVMLAVDPADGKIIVKLVDFGLAKLVQQEGDSLLARTATGEVLGTPTYMSPEQCLGRRLDACSDIYSLGCLMYELFTGVNAFCGDSPLAVMLLHVSEMPRAFSQAAPQRRIPLSIEAAIFKALAKKPEDRFRSAGEFKNAIVRASSSAKGSLATFLDLMKSRSGARRADPRLLAIIALVSCLGVVLISIVALQPPHWRKLADEAERQWVSVEDRMQAMEKMQKALDEAKADHAPCQEIAAKLRRMADLASNDEQEVALQCYELAAQALEGRTDRASRIQLVSNLNDAAYYQKKLLLFPEALATARKSVAIASEMPDLDLTLMRDAYIKLGSGYYNMKEFEKAEPALRQAQDFEDRVSKRKHKTTSALLFIKWLLCKTLLAEGRLKEAHSVLDDISQSSKEVPRVDRVIAAWEEKYKELVKKPLPRFEAM